MESSLSLALPARALRAVRSPAWGRPHPVHLEVHQGPLALLFRPSTCLQIQLSRSRNTSQWVSHVQCCRPLVPPLLPNNLKTTCSLARLLMPFFPGKQQNSITILSICPFAPSCVLLSVGLADSMTGRGTSRGQTPPVRAGVLANRWLGMEALFSVTG